jgi:hypothetical protein
VRGSTAYGKAFTKLDNGFLREGTYKDINALLDWIATQPDLDVRKLTEFTAPARQRDRERKGGFPEIGQNRFRLRHPALADDIGLS